MSKYGELTPSDISLREKMHFEGYMQMNPRNPTPYMAENERIKAERDKAKAEKEAGKKSSGDQADNANETELRQLNDIEKYSAQDASSNRPYSIVLSNSVYEKFLDTKFEQLKTAIKIGMLNEGYKTIGEIHEIIEKISTPLGKDKLSQYYSSLTEVSRHAENVNPYLLSIHPRRDRQWW